MTEHRGPEAAPADADGWSTPRLYRSMALSVPGDLASMAVATADPSSDVPERSWGQTSYHGPRRHRPREEPSAPAVRPEPIRVPPGEVVGREVGPRPERRSVLANSRIMAVASLVSRITGFVRTILIGLALGAGIGSVGDAYNLANTVPNMIYELLLGGVLTSVVIPVLVRAQQDDADDGVAYTQRLLSLATVGLAAMTVIVVALAPWLIGIFGIANPDARTAAVHLAYLLLPEILFYGLGAMFSAVLNTRHDFGWAAWTPVANNIIVIIASVIFLVVPGNGPLDAAHVTTTQILVIGLGTTIGIAAQALLLIGPMRRAGFEFRWRFRAAPNEAGRLAAVRTLSLWVLGYVVVSQIGVYVINRVGAQNGGVTIFTNADLLFQMPYGILGVSLLTALMPRMSRAAARGDHDGVLSDLRLGGTLSAVALVPITAGLIVFGAPLGGFLFLGHSYTFSDARLTGVALAAGAFGLLPFALVMLQSRVFYAMQDARTPTLINAGMVAAKLVIVLVAATTLHAPGNPHRTAILICLTVGTSVSYLVGAVVGQVLLRRRFGPLGFRPVFVTTTWLVAASVAGGVVGYLIVLGGDGLLGFGRVSGFVEVVVGSLVGGAVFVLVALRLPIPELRQIVDTVRRRSA